MSLQGTTGSRCFLWEVTDTAQSSAVHRHSEEPQSSMRAVMALLGHCTLVGGSLGPVPCHLCGACVGPRAELALLTAALMQHQPLLESQWLMD